MISKGEYDRAISDANLSIELFPNGTLSYTNRGRAYEMKGGLKRAVADFGVAINYDRENPSAYNNRVVAREKMDDRKGAIADLKRALAAKPRKGKFVNEQADKKYAKENLDRLMKEKP
jgi:tetratricopeptide (TPR) repeat protein